MQHQPQGVLGVHHGKTSRLQPLAQVQAPIESPGQTAPAGEAVQMAEGRLTRRQQQGAGAGGLQPEQSPCDPIRRHTLPCPLQKHGALSKPACCLLQRLHRQIGPAAQGRRREARVEAQVRAMGLIDQHRQSPLMNDGDQSAQVAHKPLIARGHQHHRRQRAAGQGLLEERGQLRRRGRQPETRGGIERQIEQQRLQLPEQTAMQQRAVQIARQQHPLAWSGHGQQRRLQQATGTVDAEPATLSTQQGGRSRLGLGDGPLGLQWAADRRQFGKVPAGGRLTQQPLQPRCQAAATAMGRQMQRQPEGPGGVGPAEALQQTHGPPGGLPRVCCPAAPLPWPRRRPAMTRPPTCAGCCCAPGC